MPAFLALSSKESEEKNATKLNPKPLYNVYRKPYMIFLNIYSKKISLPSVSFFFPYLFKEICLVPATNSATRPMD